MQAGGQHGGSAGGHAASTYRTLRSRHATAMLGEINVTPLVDVVLGPLLVFMVTAPMMSRGIDVSLPTANPPRDDREEDRLTVSVNAQGRVYLGDRLVPSLPLLEERVRVMMEPRVTKVVYIRADEALRYGRVITVVDTLRKAGVEQIGFVYVLPQEKAP